MMLISITDLLHDIRTVEQRYHRLPHAVTLIAASKQQSAAAIRAAATAGIRDIGENYVQEALAKQQQLADVPLVWHFIGAIQSNKTKAIATHFDWVHTIDRIAIARRLNEQRSPSCGKLNVLLQINSSGEVSKSGVSWQALFELAQQVSELPQLVLRGLMVIPTPVSDFAQQRAHFAHVRQALLALHERFPTMDQLSMGMSADWQVAIAEGATFIRLGTAIFGSRDHR